MYDTAVYASCIIWEWNQLWTIVLLNEGTQKKLDTRMTGDTRMKSVDQSESGMMSRTMNMIDSIMIQTLSISEDKKNVSYGKEIWIEISTVNHTYLNGIIESMKCIGEKV